MGINPLAPVAGLTTVNPPLQSLTGSPAQQQVGVGLQATDVEKPTDRLSFSEEARRAAELVRQSREATATVQPVSPPSQTRFEGRPLLLWLLRCLERKKPLPESKPANPDDHILDVRA